MSAGATVAVTASLFGIAALVGKAISSSNDLDD
jgi:hypothetical protein